MFSKAIATNGNGRFEPDYQKNHNFIDELQNEFRKLI